MENLNHHLFLWINASANAAHWQIVAATLFAKWWIGLLPLGVGMSVLCRSQKLRDVLFFSVVSVCVGLLLNYLIGYVWFHPRPFAVPIGQTFLQHANNASFPSNHLTIIWSFAAFLLYCHYRKLGWSIAVLIGLPVAWARIYLGVHFPLDMLGSAVVGAVSAGLVYKLHETLRSLLNKIKID